MFALAGLLSLFILASQAQAAPSRITNLVDITKYSGETSGRYIVTLKEGSDTASIFGALSKHRSSGALNVTHEWDNEFYNGFAGEFDDAALKAIRTSEDVLSIDEDGVVSIDQALTQTDATWGLSRLSQVGRVVGSEGATNYPFYFDASAGSAADIFIVDTGIRTSHVQFGGRASWGATYGGYANADGNGHGTHCAGIAGGATYGVAKSAQIIAVKVLSDAGSGYISDIVSGLNFVARAAAASGRATVASLSLGGGASQPLDDAVTSLINRGIHVTVAAGNSADDAGYYSPARAPAVTTVGAIGIDDFRASYSNYGASVDIFAPGTNIISTWSTGDYDTNSISGTSMATPFVAGLTAYFVGLLGNLPPAELRRQLTVYAVKDVLANVPGGTPNLLAHNNF